MKKKLTAVTAAVFILTLNHLGASIIPISPFVAANHIKPKAVKEFSLNLQTRPTIQSHQAMPIHRNSIAQKFEALRYSLTQA